MRKSWFCQQVADLFPGVRVGFRVGEVHVDQPARPATCTVDCTGVQIVVIGFGLFEQEGDIGGVVGAAEGGFEFTLGNLQQADFVILDQN